MTRESIRFSVSDDNNKRSSTWKCFAANNPKNDIYLTCREVGRALKVSLHESGNWHYAYIENYFEENIAVEDQTNESRFIEKWVRPPDIASGVTLAIRIVIPWGSVTTPIDNSVSKKIYWVPKPSEGQAIEFDLIITKKGKKVSNWPGKKGMNTKLVGSFKLSNGDTAWIVYQEVKMPIIEPQSGKLKFYKGKGNSNLESKNLRMLALNTEEDGSRVLYDFAVQYNKK